MLVFRLCENGEFSEISGISNFFYIFIILLHTSQRICFFLPRRCLIVLGPGFRRDTLLRFFGALLRVVFRFLFGPVFRDFAELVLRFRVLLFRIALFLDRRLRDVLRGRDLRIVFGDRDLRIVFGLRLLLRDGPILCIASQDLQ